QLRAGRVLAALDALGYPERLRPSLSEGQDAHQVATFSAVSRATPSPLGGERAGVRGAHAKLKIQSSKLKGNSKCKAQKRRWFVNCVTFCAILGALASFDF